MRNIKQLLKDWHKAGRQEFEKSAPNLDYDSYSLKTAEEKRKYIYLGEGTSMVFRIKKATGNIYFQVKPFIVPRTKICGNINTITGQQLNRLTLGI